MNKVFTSNGWEDYIYWQTEDKKTLKKINTLVYFKWMGGLHLLAN